MSRTTLKDLDPAVAQLWVNALESGDFPQGRGQLKDENGWCCLGVLCEVAQGQGIIESYDPMCYAPDYTVTRWAFPDSYEVSENAGENEQLFSTKETEYPSRLLTALNDTDQYGFKQIAAVIRKEVGL